ncbi:unnamed protein product [Didymodactylos carnosus]|uniref:Uncharacterized protein n=1 Tax=Didymodactylos carnosus TaxID=1234261 RepID=A0A8S2TPT7_9BILA|nr:unnamed protein product [Didymodactylos carnosus]CAF4302000.1 unnamed protein product [Didymodactylos carnosus]
MNRCTFTFVSIRTLLPIRVTGVQRTWEYLKEEFNRKSDGVGNNARYYETFGPGPKLFAVMGDKVYYRDAEEWVAYNSATDISYAYDVDLLATE